MSLSRLTHISSTLSSSYRKIRWCAVRWRVPMFDPFNLEQTTPSTCFETASGMRTRVPYRTAHRIRELKQTFAIRILSMLVLRERSSACAPLPDQRCQQPLGPRQLKSHATQNQAYSQKDILPFPEHLRRSTNTTPYVCKTPNNR